jgi:hypothetical protein
MAEMTYAEASNIQAAIAALEKLEAAGTISEDGQKALDAARKKRKPARQAEIETIATYRGAQKGVSLGLADEIAGAYQAANELIRKRDIEGAKKAYAKYRDLVRQRDEAAQLLAPEQFAKGEVAGGVAGAAVPVGTSMQLARGLGTAGRVATGAGTGAATAALPEFAGGEGGFGPRMAEVSPITAAAGATIGAAAPVAGRMAGAVTRGIQDVARGGAEGVSGAALRRVGRAMQRPQVAGQDIQAYLRSLGPEGVVADIAGSPRSMAQGLATMQGEGADVLRRQLEQRAGGAGERVEQVMSERIGPAIAASEERAAQAMRKSSELGPMYDAAMQSGAEFDISALRSGLVMMADDAAANVRSGLNAVLRDLGKEGPVAASKLHNARSALGDAITSARIAGQNNKVRQLMPILEEMDKRLDEIPNYATARAGYAESSQIERAVDNGRSVFAGGPTSALSPEDLKAMLDKMKPLERDAYVKGAREYIAALMGTSRSDAASAWQQFDKSWNREKLQLLLGKPDADAVTQRLFAEKEFSGTRGDVLAGSQTAFREEAAESLADIREPDSMRKPSPIARAYQGMFADPVNRMIDEVLYGAKRSNLNRQIGELLSMQGADRDRLVPVLLQEAKRLQDPTRAQQVVDALTTFGLTTYGAQSGE